LPEGFCLESGSHCLICVLIIHRFVFGRRYITNRFEQAAVVEPIDPLECRVLDGIHITPWTTLSDHFGLVQTVDRFSQRIIVTVADTADGCGNACVSQAFAITDRKILAAADALMFVKWR
jgi:hypothetical protein